LAPLQRAAAFAAPPACCGTACPRAAAAQAAWHFTLIRGRERGACFRAFRANHWVGFAVFAGTVADLTLRP
jgi:4-hydroxybenzoate polyprenyltransferase